MQDKDNRPAFPFMKACRQMNKIIPLQTIVHEFMGYCFSGFRSIITIRISIIEDYQHNGEYENQKMLYGSIFSFQFFIPFYDFLVRLSPHILIPPSRIRSAISILQRTTAAAPSPVGSTCRGCWDNRSCGHPSPLQAYTPSGIAIEDYGHYICGF
jgi:hypothetical protein